tara:strand:- start:488 stop:748 length:261 start_codon:yes stop_codon:yes gene_type:complete
MRYIKDLVATVGEYKAHDGEIKKRYQKCGAMFEGDDGRQSIKLDAIPVSPDWSGWFSLYEPKDRAQAPAANNVQSTTANQNDDIPF